MFFNKVFVLNLAFGGVHMCNLVRAFPYFLFHSWFLCVHSRAIYVLQFLYRVFMIYIR